MTSLQSFNLSVEGPISAEEFEQEFVTLKNIISDENDKLNDNASSFELRCILEYMFNTKQFIIGQEKILRKNIRLLRRAEIKSFYDIKGRLIMKDLRDRNKMISRMSMKDRQSLCRCFMNKYKSSYFYKSLDELDFNAMSPLQNPVDMSFEYETISKMINLQISPVSRYFDGCEYCKPEKSLESSWCTLESVVSPFLPSSDSDDDLPSNSVCVEEPKRLQESEMSNPNSIGIVELFNSSKSSNSKKKISFDSVTKVWEFNTDEPERQFYFRKMATQIRESHAKQVFQQFLFGFDSTDFFSWDRLEEITIFF